jgi:hypothetical protein
VDEQETPSGSHQSLSLQVRKKRSLMEWLYDFAVVLSVIQEKVNNPSADDPFEPEIAAVSD